MCMNVYVRALFEGHTLFLRFKPNSTEIAGVELSPADVMIQDIVAAASQVAIQPHDIIFSFGANPEFTLHFIRRVGAKLQRRMFLMDMVCCVVVSHPHTVQ